MIYGQSIMNFVNTIMININNEYKQLLGGILYGGSNKEDRTGTGTLSVFGRTIEHNMQHSFPILTTKRVSFNAARTELLWILNGRTDLKYLEDNGVKYWRPDYKRSGRTDETLGPVYGKQWRDFSGIDQLHELVNAIRNNPHSRRLYVSAWNPAEMADMVLPPCHYGFQIYINDGFMDLAWQQRSADVFLGLPYDITMYGLLLSLLAKGANLMPRMLKGQLGDCHLYKNHIIPTYKYLDRPGVTAKPVIKINNGIHIDNFGDLFIPDKNDIELLNYKPLPAIKAELSVGN